MGNSSVESGAVLPKQIRAGFKAKMAVFLQNIILGRKRKADNDVQCFRRLSKAQRLLVTMDDENRFCNKLGGFVSWLTNERGPKGWNEKRSSHWWRNG